MHTLKLDVLLVHGIAGDAGMGVDGGCIREAGPGKQGGGMV